MPLQPQIKNLILCEVFYSFEFVLDVFKREEFILYLLYVETSGIVGVELGEDVALFVAFSEILVVVEVAVVGRDTVEVSFIDSLCALFIGQKGLVEFFAVAYANDLDILFLATKDFADSFCLSLNGACRRLLDKDVSTAAMLKGIKNKVNCFVEAHDETGHLGLGDGDGVAFFDLRYPQGHDGATATEDVSITCACNHCISGITALGNCDFFFDGLGDTHCVDGIGCLVCGEADNSFDLCFDSSREDVICSYYIGVNSLHGEELTTGHLLESCRMEHEIYVVHRRFTRV